MDRYGEQIEADFHQYYNGLDVVDALRVDHVEGPTGVRGVRRISLRKFHALVGQLPRHGRYYSEFADDDDAVSEYMDYLSAHPELKKQIESQAKKKPTMLGYTVEAQKLDHLAASVNFIAALADQYLADGKNANKIPDVVPPETARDRWDRRKGESRLDDLFAEVKDAQRRWSARQERLKHEAVKDTAKNLPPRDALGRFVKRR